MRFGLKHTLRTDLPPGRGVCSKAAIDMENTGPFQSSVSVNNWISLVSGVGHRHWELQHTLCETRSTPGCLSPAGLAYVWLDHVPGAFTFLDRVLLKYSSSSWCRWRGPARQVPLQRRRAALRKAGQGRRSRSVLRPGRPGRRRILFLRQTRRSRPTKRTLWSMTGKVSLAILAGFPPFSISYWMLS